MLSILFEDNHLIAVDKPAGLLTQADETGESSVVDLVADYWRTKYAKPGNVFVGLLHRLDRPVSGVVLLARTSKAAARLSEQFRAGTIEKEYLALVEGTIPEDSGEWADVLRKDERRNVVEIVQSPRPGDKPARLAFRVLERSRRTTTVELRPITGRSHQLRVQLASRGWPIVGDRKYGAGSTVLALDGRPRVALHARRLGFTHPTRREATSATAPVPPDWPSAG